MTTYVKLSLVNYFSYNCLLTKRLKGIIIYPIVIVGELLILTDLQCKK